MGKEPITKMQSASHPVLSLTNTYIFTNIHSATLQKLQEERLLVY
jgi:hypothetical protein